MKKKLIFAIFVLVTILSSAVKSQDCNQIIRNLRASTEGENSYIYDFANVFSDPQKDELTTILQDLSKKTEINFFVITGSDVENQSDKYGNDFLTAANKSKPSFNLVVGTNGIFFIHRSGNCSKMMENIDHKKIRDRYLISLRRGDIPDKTIKFFTELSSVMTTVPLVTETKSSGVTYWWIWIIVLLFIGLAIYFLVLIPHLRQKEKETQKLVEDAKRKLEDEIMKLKETKTKLEDAEVLKKTLDKQLGIS